MATTIIVKNDSTSNIVIDDLGMTVPAQNQLNLTEYLTKYEITDSKSLDVLVFNGSLVVNDGTTDLSCIDGLKHVNFQTEYEDHFDELFESGPIPPTDPYSGQPWYHEGDIYHWDSVRQKWLTGPQRAFMFNSDKAKGIYLKIGSISNAVAAYYVGRPGTIVGIFCVSGSGDNTKTFEIRDGSQGDIALFSFSYNSLLEYLSDTINIDVNYNTKLKCWVSVVGDNVLDTVCQIEVSWRYTP
jgi:hypothetical protein